MYAGISEQMLNTFSTVAEFSNLIGKYQDRYKPNYKRIDHLRQLFYERVDGDMDFDRFVSYYKWIDSSISMLIKQLIPVSARISGDVSNMVESHILERNKYQSKFPLTQRYESTEGHLKGRGELEYNWKFGHAPLGSGISEGDDSLWWHERAERDNSIITVNTTIDGQRDTIRDVVTSELLLKQETTDGSFTKSGSYPKFYDITTAASYEGSTYAIRSFSRPMRMRVSEQQVVHAGTNYNRRKVRDVVHNAVHVHGPLDSSTSVPRNVMVVGFDKDNLSLIHI